MKTALAFAAALTLAGCASIQTESSGKDGVRAATAGWVDAYNSRDPQRIAGYYASDAVFWGTTSKTIRTTPVDIADYFKDAARRPQARVQLVDQYPRVWGDVGVNSGVYVFSDVRDGAPTERPARFTMVFHRREGKWVLVDHHSSEVK